MDNQGPIYSNYNAAFDDADGVQLKIVRDKRNEDDNSVDSPANEKDYDGSDVDDDSDDDDFDKDVLTGGDLMAFAWQISKGMVRLLFNGQYYVLLSPQNNNNSTVLLIEECYNPRNVPNKLCLHW